MNKSSLLSFTLGADVTFSEDEEEDCENTRSDFMMMAERIGSSQSALPCECKPGSSDKCNPNDKMTCTPCCAQDSSSSSSIASYISSTCIESSLSQSNGHEWPYLDPNHGLSESTGTIMNSQDFSLPNSISPSRISVEGSISTSSSCDSETSLLREMMMRRSPTDDTVFFCTNSRKVEFQRHFPDSSSSDDDDHVYACGLVNIDVEIDEAIEV